MAITQKPTLAPGPFDKAAKTSTAVGMMSANITLVTGPDPTIPTPFNTESVWRDERNGLLHVHATMDIISTPGDQRRSLAIAFELKNKDAPSGTYTVGVGDDVVLLGYFVREAIDLPDVRYDAVSGEIQLTNHQPEKRISGTLRFKTETRDGHYFDVSIGQFDIRGIN